MHRPQRLLDAGCRGRVIRSVDGDNWAGDAASLGQESASAPQRRCLGPDGVVRFAVRRQRTGVVGRLVWVIVVSPGCQRAEASEQSIPILCAWILQAVHDALELRPLVGIEASQPPLAELRDVPLLKGTGTDQDQLVDQGGVLGRQERGKPGSPGMADQYNWRAGLPRQDIAQLGHLAVDRPGTLKRGSNTPLPDASSRATAARLPGAPGPPWTTATRKGATP
jgi:hypothetical protein